MKYIDSNVFIYPTLYDGKKAEGASGFLKEMVRGEQYHATASLTIDEVIWILTNQASRDAALDAAKEIMSLPNLKIVSVSAEDAVLAIYLMEAHVHLKPRDAIHAAVCLRSGFHTIVSDDSDFDKVDGLVREPLG